MPPFLFPLQMAAVSHISLVHMAIKRTFFQKVIGRLKFLFRSFFVYPLRRWVDPLIQVRVRGIQISLGCASEIERYRIDSYEHKEPETLDWIDENFGPGDVLYDIGANIGIYTLYAAKRNSKGQVYAFEPEAQNFARICRNIFVNQIQNVVPCNFALADHSGYNKFFVSAGDVGSSMHSFGKVSDFAENGRAMIQQGTIAFTLDDAVNKLGLPCPQLIKLDVDGLEEQILDGAKSILLSGRVRSLLVELSFRDKGHLDSQIHRILNLGFKKRLESQWSYSAAGMTSKNYLFSRDH